MSNSTARAFAPLTDEEHATANDARPPKGEKTPITPVPDDAPKMRFRHPAWGDPVATWPYHDADGRLMGFAARFAFETDGRPDKDVLPLTFCDIGKGKRAWRAKSIPAPRPLYRLPDLVARSEAPVLIVEGEKTAEAAATLFPDMAVTTPMGGGKAPHLTDWSPLEGRPVIIWPDHDDPGADSAARVAELAMDAGAASVRIVPVPAAFPPKWDLADPGADSAARVAELAMDAGAASVRIVPVPAAFPPKWDLADPAPEGADLFALLADAAPWDPPTDEGEDAPPEVEPTRPGFMTYDTRTPYGRPGLYFHGFGKGDPPPPTDTWVCSPIWADAMTEGADGRDHGLLLRFTDPKGRTKEWAAPMSLLAGDGSDLRRELLDQGVRIDIQAGRTLLPRWIMSRFPEREVMAATRTGWLSDRSAYILPHRTIGDAEAVWQGTDAPGTGTAGTLDGWKTEVAARAVGNPLAVLALSAAFAGPLLARVHRQGAGLHLVGDSSTGKSTLLDMAASAWGHPRDFGRSWRTTSNGLEAVAAARNDGLLILDEISECDPREVGAVVYALGNGAGKTRATRSGGARPVHRWRVVALSSGERSIAASMAEGGRHQKAGQSARLLDIRCDGRTHGVFDVLNGAPDGRTLSDALKTVTEDHHGHAAPAFIEALLADGQDHGALLADLRAEPGFAAGAELEGRAASMLALIAMAGELARDYGIVPWPEGAALDAATLAFGLWWEGRTEGRPEDEQILDAVREFINRHGDTRFSVVSETDTIQTRERAGWWRDDHQGRRTYLFTSDALKEAVAGHDLTRALDALDRAEWIADRDQGKRSKKIRVPGRPVNVYAIRPEG